MLRQRINTDIEKRGFVWKCQTNADKKRFIANGETKKQPCGNWNSYFGRKWASTKGQARWQGICKKCGRKRQLNTGITLPEPPQYYTTREETEEAADDQNAQEEIAQARRNQEASNDSRRYL
tara:strand:- start:262 stop:627 length:366 start_codon:yes stop_codon:yes gene_type:complete